MNEFVYIFKSYHEAPDTIEHQGCIVSVGELTKKVDGARVQDGLLRGRELQQEVAKGGRSHDQKVHRHVCRWG